MIRSIVVENGPNKQLKPGSDLFVNYDVTSKQSPKPLYDKGTKTDNEVLNVVELDNKQSDEFLKVNFRNLKNCNSNEL